MPIPAQEITTTLMPGETVKVVGPGILEFKASKMAALGNAAAGGGAVAAKGAAAGGVIGGAGTGAGTMMAAGGVTTTAAASPVSGLASGKVLGFSLGTVNPWVLLAVGAVGGYMYFKRTRSIL